MKELFNSTILILDDDKEILRTMKLVFDDRVKSVITVSEPGRALLLIKEKEPDMVIMDMNYSKGNVNGSEGLDLLKKIRKFGHDLPIVVMTAYSEIDLVVECMRLGASDFIQKPWSNQRLLITVANILRLKNSESENVSLRAKNQYYEKNDSNESKVDFGMIGSSNAMKLVKDKISRIAESDANVLILGENGTGKELVAKAIHNMSTRNKESFIKIDLGSVHEQLFESEMFGSKKGAYTGSQVDKIGRITLADKGTLFLDELGNLPLSMQAKMLSVLQNREVIQVGATTSIPVDIRLVSATNLTVSDLLNESKFRQDLLYRINTVEIQIPPLRERVDDIPELFSFFKTQYEKKYKTGDLHVSNQTLSKAKDYKWPGNVRELQHAVERAVLMCVDGEISSEDLLPKRNGTPDAVNLDLNIGRMEKHLVENALRIHNGNMTRAAKDLGLTRAALYRRLEKYGL